MPEISRDGVKIHYEAWGYGRTLVLVHGQTQDYRAWTPQIERFSRRFKVVAYDLRGHGLSSSPRSGYGIEDHVKDLVALLDALGLKEVTLMGHSLGGGVSIGLALEMPPRVKALILVSPHVPGFKVPRGVHVFPNVEGMIKKGKVDEAIDLLMESELFKELSKRGSAAQLLRKIMSEHKWVWMKSAERKREPDYLSRLGEVKKPLLVIVGEKDHPVFKQIADEIVKRAAHSVRIMLPNCNHQPHLEDPRTFNDFVMTFLETVKF